MIYYDQYNISHIIKYESDIDLISDSIHSILGMKKNNIWDSYDWKNPTSIPISLIQIFIIELLLSMERCNYIKAKSLYLSLISLSEHDADYRSLGINLGIKNLINGNYIQARNDFYELLIKNHNDIFLFYVCHMVEFNNGLTSVMLETLNAVKDSWSPVNEFYGYFKGIEAFILNENAYYQEALASGMEAIKISSNDIYAIHAICHYFYDTKQFLQGKYFMEELQQQWHENYGMRLHLFWHYAMFLLKTGDINLLEATYNSIRKKNDIASLEDLDAVSLLFLLKIKNALQHIKVNIDDLFHSWNNLEELGFYFFNDFHAALIFGLTKKNDLVDFLIDHVKCSRPIGFYNTKLTLLLAIKSYCEEDYRQVVTLLNKPIDYRFMGGSNIQRSIISEILNHSKIKLGERNAIQ